MERLYIVFAATFLHSGDCQAEIKLILPEKKKKKKDDNDREEVRIISVKNVPHGFFK